MPKPATAWLTATPLTLPLRAVSAAPDGAGVVDRPTDVGSRIDAGHDEIDRAEHAEAGEHRAQRRRPVDAPRLLDAFDRRHPRLGLDEVQGADPGPGTGVLDLRSDDDDLAVAAHRAGEDVQAGRGDAVVVGDQDPSSS